MKERVNTSSQTVRTCDVFISYRRDGGDMTAMYFYQALKERGYRVFYDLEVLRAGKFNEALLNSIQSCKDFVLILSPHALDRCGDENDWVRKEIAEALRTKKNIIPVMLKGFAFPETLPADIDDIRYQNGLTCTTEYFEESIDRLCQRYLKSLPAKEKKGKRPLMAVLAAVAVLAVALGGFMALRGRNAPAPTPEPTATVEAATPEATEAPAQQPADVPSATLEATEAPGPRVVKDTDFPVLSAAIDRVDVEDESPEGIDFDARAEAHVLGHESLRRRDVSSVTFLPALDGAPADAWDVSEAGDGRVKAWITPSGELYDLFIAGDGGVKITDYDEIPRLFSSYQNVKSVDFNGCVDLSERTILSEMFYDCRSLESLDLSGVCTESAVSMRYMFSECHALKSLDLSGFDTANVEDFDGMFCICVALKDLNVSGFDTHKAKSMMRMFEQCQSLEALDLSAFDTSRVTDMSQMFSGASSLTALDLSGFGTGRAVDMSGMFEQCGKLESIDLSSFDTSRVTSMERMFDACASLEALDLTGFNTANVEIMRFMFRQCHSLDGMDLSGFDTSSVTNMNGMFQGCSMLYRLDVSDWNTRRVTDMQHMFAECELATELLVTNWDVSAVEQMDGMFQSDGSLKSIGRDPATFGHGNTLDMYDGCFKLEGVPSGEAQADASSAALVKDTDFPALMRGMDTVPEVTSLDIENYMDLQPLGPVFNIPGVSRMDIRSATFLPTLEGAPDDAVDASEAGDGRVLAWVTETRDGLYDLTIAGDGGVKVLENDGLSPMFSGYINLERVSFNGCVDFSGRTDMGRLFWCCHSLKEIDFTGVYTGNAASFSGLFGGCWALEALDLSQFDTSHIETFDGMFMECESLADLDVSGFDTGRCGNMESMFSGCASLKALDVSGFDTSHVQQMEYMFNCCLSLEALDVSRFDTSRVTDMERMFGECELLEELNVSGFDTGRVVNMYGMFIGCAHLPRLDVSGFDTARVEDMGCMFSNCFELDGLDLTQWDTGRVVSMGSMFDSCSALYKLDLSGWDIRQVVTTEAMFSLCRTLVEVNLDGWDVSGVETMARMFEGCGNLESIGRDPGDFGHGDTAQMYDGCDRLPIAQ